MDDRLADLLSRLDYRRRDLGEEASCEACGEATLLLLQRCGGRILCYQCDRVARGFPATEEHHLGGTPSPLPPVRIPGNLHRLLTAWQDITWRGVHAPGSPEAVALDLAALIFLRDVLGLVGRPT